MQDKDGVRLRVYVRPRSRKDAILGLHGDALKVSIVSPPVGGAANRALRGFLARVLDIPASRIEIVSGHTSTYKMVKIFGLSPDRVKAFLLQAETRKRNR